MAERPLYIFCGGGSRRMGQDKALLEVHGKPLLEHQINKAFPHFSEIILLSGDNSYSTEFRQVPDSLKDAGPLAGLLAGLKDAEKMHSHITVIPVDVPLLSEKTLKRLASSAPDDKDKTILCRHLEKIQPLAGIYPVKLVDPLEEFLEKGDRRVMNFIETLNCRYIDVEAYELQNINYPEDYNSIR